MPHREAALQDHSYRGFRFWLACALATSLPIISWGNHLLVARLNLLLHRPKYSALAWSIYTVFRLLLSVALVLVVLSFRRRPSTKNAATTRLTSSKNFDPLMGLRALACGLVLMGHFFIVVFPFSMLGHSDLTVTLFRASPWGGVWVFFTLSGYLMGKGFVRKRYTLDEPGIYSFFRNRVLRILPVYYVGVLLLSIWKYTDIFHLKNIWNLIEILIFDYRGELPINPIGALWSVATEVQFYLLAPFLVLVLIAIYRRYPRSFVFLPVLFLALGTAVRVLLQKYLHSGYIYGYTPLLTNLDIFIAGMSMNFLPAGKKITLQSHASLHRLMILSSIAFWLAISYFSSFFVRFHASLEDFWAWTPGFCALFAMFFIYLAEARGRIPIKSNLSGRFLLAIQGMGTLTYCLYVFHPEVYLSYRSITNTPVTILDSLRMFFPVMTSVAGVALFFYFAVEKPFEGRKQIDGGPLTDAP